MKSILILHGWGSSSKNWSRVKEILERQGYRVYVPDLPGFGESPPPSQPWSIDDYTDWVKEYSEKQNLSQFFLLGHSFGGRITIKFAIKYPKELQGLILCGAAGVTKRRTAKVFLFLILSKFGRLLISLSFLAKFQLRLQEILYFFAGQRDYFSTKGTMKETFKKVITEDLKPYLDEIKTPTLIVWGKEDRLTPLRDAYLIKKEIKGAKLEIIEGGHALNLEMPEILAEKVLNFLKS